MSSAVNDYAVVSEATQGVGVEKFDVLLEVTGLQKAVLASLIGVDPRTIDNYRKHGKKFDMLEGELLIKLSRLFGIGMEVFEDMNEFKEWLLKASLGLGGKVPMELLRTITGVDLVNDELMRIEHGYAI